jgi:hypothetical protein
MNEFLTSADAAFFVLLMCQKMFSKLKEIKKARNCKRAFYMLF